MEHLKLEGTRKLNPRFIGPFEVAGPVGCVAYHLTLPPASAALFPVFYVSKLHAYCDNGGDGTEPPPPILLDGQEEFEVEMIVAQCGTGQKC